MWSQNNRFHMNHNASSFNQLNGAFDSYPIDNRFPYGNMFPPQFPPPLSRPPSSGPSPPVNAHMGPYAGPMRPVVPYTSMPHALMPMVPQPIPTNVVQYMAHLRAYYEYVAYIATCNSMNYVPAPPIAPVPPTSIGRTNIGDARSTESDRRSDDATLSKEKPNDAESTVNVLKASSVIDNANHNNTGVIGSDSSRSTNSLANDKVTAENESPKCSSNESQNTINDNVSSFDLNVKESDISSPLTTNLLNIIDDNSHETRKSLSPELTSVENVNPNVNPNVNLNVNPKVNPKVNNDDISINTIFSRHKIAINDNWRPPFKPFHVHADNGNNPWKPIDSNADTINKMISEKSSLFDSNGIKSGVETDDTDRLYTMKSPVANSTPVSERVFQRSPVMAMNALHLYTHDNGHEKRTMNYSRSDVKENDNAVYSNKTVESSAVYGNAFENGVSNTNAMRQSVKKEMETESKSQVNSNIHSKGLQKLIIQLKKKYQLSDEMLIKCIDNAKAKSNIKSFTGMKFNEITTLVSDYIDDNGYNNTNGCSTEVDFNRNVIGESNESIKTNELISKMLSSKTFFPKCSICVTEIEQNKSYVLGCGHRYHLMCIREWLKNNMSCPNCKNTT